MNDAEGVVRRLRVGIVDANRMSLQMMRHMIESDREHDVAGDAASPAAARKMILSKDPDVVLIEFRLGNIDALELIAEIRELGKNPAFVIVASHCDEVTAHRIEKARVHGFLDRRAELFDAVKLALREIAQGRRYFSHTMLRFRDMRIKDPFSFDKVLTPRQHQILTQLARLRTDEQIIRDLKISACTLRGHRRTIARKFDVTIKDLPRFAREKGFGA